MMTSSNGNIFRVTGHFCGEFTGPPVNSTHKGQWRGALMFSLICAWINPWVNNGEAGDLRRYRAHYDVIVMVHSHFSWTSHNFSRFVTNMHICLANQILLTSWNKIFFNDEANNILTEAAFGGFHAACILKRMLNRLKSESGLAIKYLCPYLNFNN